MYTFTYDQLHPISTMVFNLLIVLLISVITSLAHGDNLRRCWTASNKVGHCFPMSACRQWHPRETRFRQCLGYQGLICCQRPQLGPSNKNSGLRSLNSLLNELADQQSMANNDISTCGVRNGQQVVKKRRSRRIVGGHDVAIGAHPWFAGLMYKEWLICGATVISDRLLVTAAHCVLHLKSVHKYKIILGSSSVGSGVVYELSAMERHPAYKDYLPYNDIAILVTDRPMVISGQSHLRAACLPPPSMVKFEMSRKIGSIVGFGTLYFEGPIPITIQEAAVPIIDNKICTAVYGRNHDKRNKSTNDDADESDLADFFVHGWLDSLICAGYGNGEVDACQGDSGGPLLMVIDGRWTLMGIISIGFKCAEPGFPGVYTRVSSYLDWIHKFKRTYP